MLRRNFLKIALISTFVPSTLLSKENKESELIGLRDYRRNTYTFKYAMEQGCIAHESWKDFKEQLHIKEYPHTETVIVEDWYHPNKKRVTTGLYRRVKWSFTHNKTDLLTEYIGISDVKCIVRETTIKDGQIQNSKSYKRPYVANGLYV